MNLNIIFVSRFAVKVEGHGGYHRSYQIWHDLCRLVGEDNVIKLNLEPQNIIEKNVSYINKYWSELVYRIKFLGDYLSVLGSPARHYDHLLMEMSKSKNYFKTVPLKEYQQLVSNLGRAVICIVDHPDQGNLIDWNIRQGIPTFFCPQNIEALDVLAGSFENKFREAGFFNRFYQEMMMLSNCEERLCISKVETGLLGGLGIPSHYYPYLPVGAIRERLEIIRAKRENHSEKIDSKFFLMLGSTIHHTTNKSFILFIEQIAKNGLPDGVQLSIVGQGTNGLKSKIELPSCLDVLGWLPQDKLDEMLCRINAVIIPQNIGFGVMTRLPELACAGIPVLVSTQPTYALNLPPGVVAVSDSWDEWYQKIEDCSKTSPGPLDPSYYLWEKEQPQPLDMIIGSWSRKFASQAE